MTIAKLASQGGVGVETVRFYQRRGLMPVPKRLPAADGDGGIRRYGPADVRRLRFIKAAQAAGFTLQEVGELLALNEAGDRSRAQKLARTRISAIESKIAQLKAARNALSKLADRCARSKAGPCPILNAFERS